MHMSMDWIRSFNDGKQSGIELFLHCQPGAKKTEIQGIYAQRLKLRLAAPPIEGRANEALIAWLAKAMNITKSQISLVSGDTGRQKRVRISGLDLAQGLKLLDVSA